MDIFELISFIVQALTSGGKTSRQQPDSRTQRRDDLRGQLTQALQMLREQNAPGAVAGSPPVQGSGGPVATRAASGTGAVPPPAPIRPAAGVAAAAVAPPVPRTPGVAATALFAQPASIAAAVVAAEVLGPPLALRR